MELPKKYNTKESEKKWQKYWEDNKIYETNIYEEIENFDESEIDDIYSIDTPPPTVSGKMHIGHAFSYAQGDFIARFNRMLGKKVFYPFGTDDNGLPTEHLVEKLNKVRSTKLKKSEFVDLCLNTIEKIKPDFMKPWKDLGISANFKESYSTINKKTIKISQKSFLDLYKKGLIYRSESPISWCTKCQTAIAQAEFENIEKESLFTNIAFHDEDGKELIIATTRPELLPACVALFAHPDDEKYKYLKNKKAIVPIFNYEVPILFDKNVEKDKGTGLMMVCTFGDKEDVEKWQIHNLNMRIAIDKKGYMNELANEFNGMKIDEARKAILEKLEESNYIKSQEKILHNTNVHERDGVPIEFMITKQWFIKVMDKKELLLKAGENIKWYPEHMKSRYKNWVENLNWDWCISRQRHFGVPFPLWYDKNTGDVVLPEEDELPINPTNDIPKSYENKPDQLIPEYDVMDTWATSSITPQIAFKWGEIKEEKFNKLIPMNVRLQAHDIIRTWAFYTITKSILHHNKVPWEKIMISGHALDPKGKKMSKSKGNTVDPIKTMEKYNADSLRYWAAGSKLGEDLPFQEKDLVTGTKTITKLFNASKFSIMHLEDYKKEELSFDKLELMDKWLLIKYSEVLKNSTNSFKEYEYAKAKLETDTFFWHTFCDYYLEIVKGRLYNPEIFGEEKRKSAQYTLYKVLLGILKLFAPIMPFITEEIYQMYFKEQENIKSIHISNWPNEKYEDISTIKIGDLFIDILLEIRKYKSMKNISLGKELGEIKIESKIDLENVKIDLENSTKSKISFEKVENPTIETDKFKIFIPEIS